MSLDAPGAVLRRYVTALTLGLRDAGVRDVCVAPGSRSTPLALAIARDPALTLWMHLDERSAAFFALGMAKAEGRPVAVLCTSGTAAANFAPAVHEARLSRVPLVLLTADRPPELRDVGAPQTIDQIHLYGDAPKRFAEMSPPDDRADLLRAARVTVARLAAFAVAEPAGPVHLNLPFRDPLVPDAEPMGADPTDAGSPAERAAGEGTPLDLPSTSLTVRQAPRRPAPEEVGEIIAAVSSRPRGLIVCGPQRDAAFPAAVARLASATGYPVLADPLSLVRRGSHDRGHVLDAYDAVLRDPEAVRRLLPDLVIQFGQTPTSKPLTQFLERLPAPAGAPRHVLVTDSDGWNDFAQRADLAVRADAVAFCDALAAALPDRPSAEALPDRPSAKVRSWVERWRAVDGAARAALTDALPPDILSEPAVFADLAGLLPDGAALFTGSSMPVRDLDTFTPGDGRAVEYLANRGANGIDGVVSSALGVAAVRRGPLVLTIGDISLYHDMNGLLAARRHDLSATIVLIHNDGGGIFHFLPQAEDRTHFETLFGTPHGLDFSHAAALYGLRHVPVHDRTAFRAAVRESLGAPGVDLIEVRTERDPNVALHRECWEAVRAAVAPELP